MLNTLCFVSTNDIFTTVEHLENPIFRYEYIIYPNRGFSRTTEFSVDNTNDDNIMNQVWDITNFTEKSKFNFQAKNYLCHFKNVRAFREIKDMILITFYVLNFWFIWFWGITDCRLLNAFYVKRKITIDIKLFIIWKTNQTTVITSKFNFTAFKVFKKTARFVITDGDFFIF
jgi:hypothetical protein